MTNFKYIFERYYFFALLPGLIATQVIATFHVYTSNSELFTRLSDIQNAGYLAVPNQHVMTGLQSCKTAFLGGLFFTFSVGAGLGLIALAAGWVWDRLTHRNKNTLLLLIAIWAALLIAANLDGFSVFISLYALCIPLIVFIAAIRLMPPPHRQFKRRYLIIHWVSILLLAFFWATQVDDDVFVDLRDSLLLSNAAGTKLSNFYYRYNLYPAEAIKSLDQKMLKTCALHTNGSDKIQHRLESKLLANDYLPVQNEAAADLELIQNGNLLHFEQKKKRILEVSVNDFLSQPAEKLSQYSQSIDRRGFLRSFTFYSLIFGFPVAFFILTHSLITSFLLLFVQSWKASVYATIIFLFIGLGLLLPLHIHRSVHVAAEDVEKALKSAQRRERIAALKVTCQLKIDITRFAFYSKLLNNPDAAERYWIARALGFSTGSNGYKDVLLFLDDPHLNVRTMAYYALGQLKRTNAKRIILNRIKNSHDWYDQWYAYKALRALGWKQTKSL